MTNHTTLDTSAEILRLCEEKGVDAPKTETGMFDLSPGCKVYRAFSVPDLLMWSGWGDWAVTVERFPRGDGSIRIYATATKKSILGYRLVEEKESNSPAEALGLLLIEYLRTL